MIKMGVYVNDLNLHDSSRELILAGTQQSAELQLALDQVNLYSTGGGASTGELKCTESPPKVHRNYTKRMSLYIRLGPAEFVD